MKTKNVLICEDDPVQLKILTTLVNQAGYRPVSARTPSEAVVAARRCGVDAVLTDVQLQDGNAFDLIGDLRRSGIDAPILFASAYATEGMRDRAREAGVREFFEKPFDLPKIRQQIDRVVQAQKDLHATVLIVESHPQVRADFEKTVAGAGFRVIAVGDGVAALDVIGSGKTKIDLMLTDLHAEGGSGASLIQKALAMSPALHVIMMSGDANRDEIRAGYDAGAFSLLRKPISSERLISFLTESLRNARAQQEKLAKERAEKERHAAKPITTRMVIDAKHFAKTKKGRNAVILSAVAVASLLIGAFSALAARRGLEASDKLDAMTDRMFQMMGMQSQMMMRNDPASRWQAGEQLRMMNEQNQTTRRYYEGQLEEQRWQNRPQAAAPQAAPVAPELVLPFKK